MLLVSGFKPIQTNYRNQNSNKTNFSQPQLHTKTDSVSFTSKTPTSKLHALVNQTFMANQGLFGRGFKNLMTAVDKFLAEQKLSISYKQATKRLRINPNSRRTDVFFDIENGVQATMLNERGEPIHYVELLPEVDKNVAKMELVNRFLGESMSLESSESYLLDAVRSPEAQGISHRIFETQKALEKFNDAWVEIDYGNENAKKIQEYQAALKRLMPEEQK